MNKKSRWCLGLALLLFLQLLGATAEPPSEKKEKTVGEVLGQYTYSLDAPEGEAPPPKSESTETGQPAQESETPKEPILEKQKLSDLKESAPEISEEAAAALNTPSSKPLPSGDWKRNARVGKSTFFDKLVDVTWSLSLVCLLIWAISKVVGKATLEKMGVPGMKASQIEVLERKRLSPGRSIILVRVGPKVLALGATESGFQTLTEMGEEELKRHKDSPEVESEGEPDSVARGGELPTSPADIAKHYLSIIPGLGEKK